MMDHTRQQIRSTAATAIDAVASYVYTSRVHPHKDLPSLTVLTPLDIRAEDLEHMGTAHGVENQLVIEARAKKAAGVDDTLDALCASVEAAIAGDTDLAALVLSLTYTGTEIDFDADLEQPIALARMTWATKYWTDPALSIPTFDDVDYLPGDSVMNLYCDTSRMALVRFRLQMTAGEGGAPVGDPLYSSWSTVYKTNDHGKQISGLTAEKWYQASVIIDAQVNPDLTTWTLLDDGITGPNFQTLAIGNGDPPPPAE